MTHATEGRGIEMPADPNRLRELDVVLVSD